MLCGGFLGVQDQPFLRWQGNLATIQSSIQVQVVGLLIQSLSKLAFAEKFKNIPVSAESTYGRLQGFAPVPNIVAYQFVHFHNSCTNFTCMRGSWGIIKRQPCT